MPDKKSQQHQAQQGFQPNQTTGGSNYGVCQIGDGIVTECDGGDEVVNLSIGITTPIKNVHGPPPLKTEKQAKQAKLSIHAGFTIVWV